MKTKYFLFIFVLASLATMVYPSCNESTNPASTPNGNTSVQSNDSTWHMPDSSKLANEPNAELIRYGEKLIANTSYYLGPKGTVAHVSNGMNCQNCHQQAGTKTYGNNFGAVASIYPRFRPGQVW